MIKNMKFAIGVFLSLAFVRILSAIYAPIADCDETYNYWEPLHLLMYGHGLQTWEYSPVYGLRSYFFILLHSPVGYFFSFMFFRKPYIFFLVRSSIGVVCAAGETFFIESIFQRFSAFPAFLTWIFLFFAPGMFNLAQNFLPGTFSMIFLLFTFGVWLRLDKLSHEDSKRRRLVWLGTFCACVAIVVGWPFVVVCVFIIVIECFTRENFFWLVKACIMISILVIVPMVLVDSFLYKKLMFATWNLVMYNKGSGSEKYGVEDWNFYFRNLLTGFNFVFVASVIAPFFILLLSLVSNKLKKRKEQFLRQLIFLTPFFLWLGFYSSIPHKEERFMAPIYPLLCFSASLCIWTITKILFFLIEKKPVEKEKDDNNDSSKNNNKESTAAVIPPPSSSSSLVSFLFVFLFLVVFIVLSVSRIYNVLRNYGAPLNLYGKLYWELDSVDKKQEMVKVCVGKEWYRFSSSFFLPYKNTRLFFVRSHFDGLLPKYFDDSIEGGIRNIISSIPDGMNDQNIEEMDRYVDKEECHYLVDFDFKGQSEERYYQDEENFEIKWEEEFLDIGESHSALARAFFIPWYSEKRNVYGRYYVLENKKIKI